MRISAHYSKKVQVKQYEPVEISCSVEEELHKEVIEQWGIDEEKVYNRLFNFCKEQVEKRIDLETRIIDAKKVKLDKQNTVDGEINDLIGE